MVEAPADLRGALARLLFKVAVVDDLDAARALVADLPDVTAVTRDGDVFGAHFVAGGSSSQPSLIEIQAAVDEAAEQLAEAVASAERLGFETSRLEAERLDAQQRVDVALAKLHESDATLAAVAEELGQYGSQARAARGEAERLAPGDRRGRGGPRRATSRGLAELEQRLASAEEAPDEEPDTTERERLADESRAARQAEMDARLRCAPPRSGPAPCTAGPTGCSAPRENEREARARAAERRERLIREGRAAEAVGRRRASSCSTGSRGRSRWPAAARDEVERSRQGREQDLLAVRATLRDLAREHDELVNSVHRDEMARTQQRMRIEQLEERALEELGLDADGLVGDYGPDQLVPFTGEVEEGAEPPEPVRRTSARSSRSGSAPPSGRCRCWAGSTRSRWRSSARWRSATSSSPSRWRTSRAPAATCSTSSARSTPGSSRSSPRPTPT